MECSIREWQREGTRDNLPHAAVRLLPASNEPVGSVEPDPLSTPEPALPGRCTTAVGVSGTVILLLS